MPTDTPVFDIAKILTEKAVAQKSFAMVAKDVSWLWRTAYNCAVQACSEWVNCEERIAELFDISRQVRATTAEYFVTEVTKLICV
jgi:hypothetical protein